MREPQKTQEDAKRRGFVLWLLVFFVAFLLVANLAHKESTPEAVLMRFDVQGSAAFHAERLNVLANSAWTLRAEGMIVLVRAGSGSRGRVNSSMPPSSRKRN